MAVGVVGKGAIRHEVGKRQATHYIAWVNEKGFETGHVRGASGHV